MAKSKKKSKKTKGGVEHLMPTSIELRTEPERVIQGTSLRGASLGGLLFYTDDLDQFHFIPGNRMVRGNRIKTLEKTFRKYGWIYNAPGTVTPTGGIVDAQARYRAAQETGHGMFFTILDPDIPEEESIKIFNEGQSNWNFWDYFSGLKTNNVEPFCTLWDTWQAMQEDAETTLSATAFLSAFAIKKTHLRREVLPESYNFTEGLATIREIVSFAEVARDELDNAFKRTKCIRSYRYVRSFKEYGWKPSQVRKTLQNKSISKKTLLTWRDSLTADHGQTRRLTFEEMHNYNKSTIKFTPPPEYYRADADEDAITD